MTCRFDRCFALLPLRGWLSRQRVVLAGLLVLTALGTPSRGQPPTNHAPSPADERPLYEAALIAPVERLRLADGRPSHNHSASIVETPAGDLIACWFHGRGERTDNTMVTLGARRNKGAAQWSEPFVMADHKQLPDQNPTLFIDPQGRLWLFRISSLDNQVRGHFITYLISTDYEDDGPPRWTWQAPLFCFPRDLEATYTRAVDQLLADEHVTDQLRAELIRNRELAQDKLWHRLGWMPRQPPIMLDQRRMMLGLYSDLWGCSLMAFTDDGGETWDFSPPVILSQTLQTKSLQPSLVRKRNGHVVAFMRSRRGDRLVHRAESSDGGLTWSEDPLPIKGSDSSVAVLGLRNGHWLLAVNDAGRRQLTLYLSEDEGQTWPWQRPLEQFSGMQGSGHYPTLIQAADGSVHIVYTYHNLDEFEGKTIKHVRFNEAWAKAIEPRS